MKLKSTSHFKLMLWVGILFRLIKFSPKSRTRLMGLLHDTLKPKYRQVRFFPIIRGRPYTCPVKYPEPKSHPINTNSYLALTLSKSTQKADNFTKNRQYSQFMGKTSVLSELQSPLKLDGFKAKKCHKGETKVKSFTRRKMSLRKMKIIQIIFRRTPQQKNQRKRMKNRRKPCL